MTAALEEVHLFHWCGSSVDVNPVIKQTLILLHFIILLCIKVHVPGLVQGSVISVSSWSFRAASLHVVLHMYICRYIYVHIYSICTFYGSFRDRWDFVDESGHDTWQGRALVFMWHLEPQPCAAVTLQLQYVVLIQLWILSEPLTGVSVTFCTDKSITNCELQR